MYAIIKSGSKQYKVKEGDVIWVDLLHQDKGSVVEFDEVLFFNDGEEHIVGVPTVSGCVVKGEVLGDVKGKKIVSFKFKRRKNYHRKIGHRQQYSQVRITEIVK